MHLCVCSDSHYKQKHKIKIDNSRHDDSRVQASNGKNFVCYVEEQSQI